MHYEDIESIYCQSCSARINCLDCTEEWKAKIDKIPGITRYELDMRIKTLDLETEPGKEQDVLEALFSIGMFV